MTSLHVICGLPPPTIKNLGYAYVLDGCGFVALFEVRQNEQNESLFFDTFSAEAIDSRLLVTFSSVFSNVLVLFLTTKMAIVITMTHTEKLTTGETITIVSTLFNLTFLPSIVTL